jgi:hypothetical protein
VLQVDGRWGPEQSNRSSFHSRLFAVCYYIQNWQTDLNKSKSSRASYLLQCFAGSGHVVSTFHIDCACPGSMPTEGEFVPHDQAAFLECWSSLWFEKMIPISLLVFKAAKEMWTSQLTVVISLISSVGHIRLTDHYAFSPLIHLVEVSSPSYPFSSPSSFIFLHAFL